MHVCVSVCGCTTALRQMSKDNFESQLSLSNFFLTWSQALQNQRDAIDPSAGLSAGPSLDFSLHPAAQQHSTWIQCPFALGFKPGNASLEVRLERVCAARPLVADGLIAVHCFSVWVK